VLEVHAASGAQAKGGVADADQVGLPRPVTAATAAPAVRPAPAIRFAGAEVLGQSADIVFTDDDRQHRRKDGSRFLGNGVTMVMLNTVGEPVGFIKILRDLSQQTPIPAR
jgi:hypothetical protein